MAAQIAEKIIINDKEYTLLTKPLDILLRQINPKMDFKPFEVSKEKEYSANWLIQNNILYLKDIEIEDSFEFKKTFESYLYGYENKFAYWFSGILIANVGKPIWWRKGIDPVYEKELIYQFENGIVKNHEVIKNETPF